MSRRSEWWTSKFYDIPMSLIVWDSQNNARATTTRVRFGAWERDGLLMQFANVSAISDLLVRYSDGTWHTIRGYSIDEVHRDSDYVEAAYKLYISELILEAP